MSVPASSPRPDADLDPGDSPQPATHPSPRALLDPGTPPSRVSLPPAPPTSTDDTLRTPGARHRPRRGGRGPRGVDPRPGQIPGLDGLRALAILAVLAFHFVPAALPGGFLGVDVFFVVSGFLITTLLLREIDSRGRVDLLNFWRRRARRLVPPLLAVVVVSVVAARLVGGDLLVGIGRQTVGALTFTSNWLEIAAGSSYFHSTSPILFVNFWSLAVEEQFYLLWPLTLVVVLAFAPGTRARVATVAGVGLASTLLMAVLFTSGEDATRVYYGTDTHLVGLMGGAALALAWADPTHRAGLRSPIWRRVRGPAVLAALLTLAALTRWGSEGSALTFRGGIALASVATVVLIAGLLEAPSPWRRAMSLPPLVWLGRRSYGIYLWHWPVLVIAGALVPYAAGTARGAAVLLSALAVTLVLAEVSWRALETPVRRRGIRASLGDVGRWFTSGWHRSRLPRIVAGGLTLLLVGTVVALATAPEKSATQRQIEESQARIDSGSAGSPPAQTTSVGRDATGLGVALGGAPAEDETEQRASEDAEEGTGDSTDSSSDDDAAQDAEDEAEQQAAPSPGEVQVNGSTFRPDEEGLLVPPGDELTAIGDSLVVTSADGLTYRFPGTSYLAESNRQWSGATDLVAAAVEAGEVRDNVVLHLGTNAGVDEKALRSVLDTFGPDRNVVVMDLYVQASFTEKSNETIRSVVADYPHAVVGTWNETISQQPQVLQSDQVHPDIDGMHVYAEVVARAFDELARRG
ncbi:lipopolysaccharide modification acyltransferase [Serinicoccus hydrothermalis]|uniref:Lipopolysaccharide modification acyltransferase n=1 Tax=Serinicoccus hydrothermalis TaxID=1758689 RepID=A0A1B1NCX6_9MICO|nr:lipopolysaccharide modification acyltransferase [Serinicoccus hydrothermalis]